MTKRTFSHANNPSFASAESVLLLPFGRRSYLPAIVEAWDGEGVTLDETTDREVYHLRGASRPVTLPFSVTSRGIPDSTGWNSGYRSYLRQMCLAVRQFSDLR